MCTSAVASHIRANAGQARWADIAQAGGAGRAFTCHSPRLGRVGHVGRAERWTAERTLSSRCCRGRHPAQGTPKSACAQTKQSRTMRRRRGQREGRAQGQEAERFADLSHLAESCLERELERNCTSFVGSRKSLANGSDLGRGLIRPVGSPA